MSPAPSPGRWALRIALVALAYFVTGELGMTLAYVGSSVTLVWPPTGIALAALFLLGPGAAPGVLLGATAVNLVLGSPPAVALVIGVGNTLGPAVGAWALRRMLGDTLRFDHSREALWLAVVAPLAMIIPCGVGVATLVASGAVQGADAPVVALRWWLGDAVGAVVVAPVALASHREEWSALSRAARAEAAILLAVTALVAAFVFLNPYRVSIAYLALAPLVWAGLRFPTAVASLMVLVMSVLAVLGTASDAGPFAGLERTRGLLELAGFLGSASVLNLLVTGLIAERRRAAEALESERARIAAIIDSAMDAILSIDAEGRIVRFNPAAERTFGRATPEVLGTAIDAIVPGLVLDPRVSATGAVLPLTGRHASGRDVPLEASVSRATSAGRGEVVFTIVARDVTQRLEAERAREELERDLAHARKLEALGTLSGGIAHDFNNLLAAILGNAELALLDVATDSPLHRALDEIRTASRRAADLVRQMLAFGRKGPSRRKPLDVVLLVEESTRLLRASLPRDHHIEVRAAAGLPAVLGDASELQRVLLNLGSNASHAMGRAPGTLTLALDVPEAEGPTPMLRLTVTDTGTGIDPETLSRIFDPFFTTKGPQGGTGLGLSVAHGIVAKHGGRISARSELGRGTTFEILLPVTDDTPELDEAPLSRPQVRTDGAHVLVVDDEPGLARLFARVLEDAGYRVTSTTDPDVARELAGSPDAHVALLLTDLAMPRVTGLELARAVRRARPALPIVLLSGNTSGVSPSEVREAGIVAVLDKPVEGRVLVEAIERALASDDTASRAH